MSNEVALILIIPFMVLLIVMISVHYPFQILVLVLIAIFIAFCAGIMGLFVNWAAGL